LDLSSRQTTSQTAPETQTQTKRRETERFWVIETEEMKKNTEKDRGDEEEHGMQEMDIASQSLSETEETKRNTECRRWTYEEKDRGDEEEHRL
jgi:hypothetical protein